MCEETTSKLRSEVENCVSEVNASGGDSDVRSSANGLTGAGLSDDASKAADAVSKARTTFANRLTNHHNGIYNATNQLNAADGAVAACTPKSGHS
jgi:hypothetical protein avisC_04379